jgi:putative DNA primase/helicase
MLAGNPFADLFPYDATRKACKGYDLADAKEEGWTADSVQSVIEEIGEDKLFPAVLCSSLKGVNTEGGMFKLKPSGVYKDDDTKICGYLKPIASCRDKNGNEWAVLVEFIDKDFRHREMFIPLKSLSKDGSAVSELLLDAGLWVNVDPKEGRQALKYYLNQTPRERMVLVNKTGWHGQNYVLPGKVWGEEQKEKIRLHREGRLPIYKENGSLGEWNHHIGQYAEGNSRLQIGILMALGSTVLSPLQRENFGVHLVGKSSSGKSTALKVTCSVFGSEFRTWRTTDNSAESWGVSCNDNILCVDEIGKAPSPAVVSEMLYLLGDGHGKGRADRYGDAREVNRFRACFLSSGEMGVEAKLNDGPGKKTYYAGQSVRLAEIPADAGAGEKMGIYETLHHFEDGAKLSDHLSTASTQYCGSLGDAWLTYLTQNFDESLAFIPRCQEAWLERRCLGLEADGQVKRVAGHFSFFAAVGELAIARNLLPWAAGSASEACAKVFEAWLNLRGGIDSHENTQAIKKLLTFIEEHGSSRFENPWDPNKGNQSDTVKNEKVFNRAGFRRIIDKQYVYYFLPKSFEANILDGAKGEAQRSLLKMLADKGYLETYTENREQGKIKPVHSITMHIPTYGTKRVYAVKLAEEI